MRKIPKPYEIYRHFKGRDYQILAIAKSADDLHEMVVYQGLYEPYQIYVRDLAEFLSPVDRSRYPDAEQEERFKEITFGTPERREMQETAPRRETPAVAKVSEQREKEDSEAHVVSPEPPVHHETPGERAMRQKPGIDPVLLRFLDAETDDEKLDVLTQVRQQLTPALFTPMELSLGMEPQEGVDPDIRYKQIKNTLQYKQKYEKSRRG